MTILIICLFIAVLLPYVAKVPMVYAIRRESNQSIPRNRRIANTLYYHKFFESWGRGIRLIIDSCIEAEHQTPIYTTNSGGLLLTIPYNFSLNKALQGSEIENLTTKQKELIFLIEQHQELSTTELKDMLSFKPSERWVS